MQNRLPKRNEVAKELTWRLEDIYDDESKWEAELKEAGEIADKMAGYAGKISADGETLLEYLKLDEQLDLLMDRIHGYAHMREDQDTADAKYQALKQRAASAYVMASEKTAFMRPEILSLSDA
ncbi:MAG: oligoendopeptidase F, partial [Lachnospiraceae bacterium]|nr:oligoendopeptidase F [Lachnospiraceae bacterium]